jgi:hypothetical protein
MQKLFLTLVLGLATAAHASLNTSYNNDISQYKSGFVNSDKSWVWVYVPFPDGKTGTSVLYKRNGNDIEAAIIWAPPNKTFPANVITTMLMTATDRINQSWTQYHTDQYGNPEYKTNDNRLCAKTFWNNGLQCLRICYATFLTKNGGWRYDNVATKSKAKSSTTVAVKPKVKVRENPKARVAPEDRPLLPPIEFAAPAKES